MIPQFRQKKNYRDMYISKQIYLILVALTFISINNKIAINKT
jgi:hypothetical protein